MYYFDRFIDSVGDSICSMVGGTGNAIVSVVESSGIIEGIDYVTENPVETLIAVSLIATPFAPAIAATLSTTGVLGVASTTSGVALSAVSTIGLTSSIANVASASMSGVAAGSTSLAAGVSTKGIVSSAGSRVITMAVKSGELTTKKVALYAATTFTAQQFSEHIVDNYIRDNVLPVKGCVVYCDLGIIAEHSGIYIGDGMIVHLNGMGNIEMVTREEFLRGQNSINPAISIYVSSSNGKAVGNIDIAERAITMVGRHIEYNILLNNCHQFTSGCITGDFDNSDNFWWMLKRTTEQHYVADSWRVWGTPR